MKITKTEFFNKLDKIGLLDYLIDYNRNINYFYYKGFKYCLCSEIINGKLTETFYKFNK
jgi:hypothetical protein